MYFQPITRIHLGALVALLFLLTACATPAVPAATTDQSADSAFPVTVERCGEEVTIDAPPERAIVFEANMIEIMLELGLDDRIAGVWTGDTPADKVQPAYSERTEPLTVISTESWPPPSLEVVLGADPDFVWSGWGYGFSEESGLTPAKLAEVGIGSYVVSESCPPSGDTQPAMGFDQLYHDILAAGQIFGVRERAEALVAELQAEVQSITDAVGTVDEPLRVFNYDSGQESPFTSGALAMPHTLITLAGGEHIFADVADDWFTTSWEEVIGRDPEVILVSDSAWAAYDDNVAFLQSQPELADVSAIQNARFIPLTYKQATPGLENVVALRTIAEGLYPEKFVDAAPADTASADSALTENPQECVASYDPAVDYFPAKVNADYAEDWQVTYFNHYKVVTVGPVGDAAAGDTETYVLVQCGTPAPELTGDLADAHVVEIPVERLFETSGGGSVVTGLEVLGEADALIGLGYIPIGDIDQYIPAVAAQIASEDFLVVNVSEGGFEAVVAAEPDLLIEPYNAEQRAAARELGIPAIFYNSFWETPLGGAEHIKFWSLLFNKEALANQRFAPIEADYLALKEQVAQAVAADERPLVLHGQVSADNTFSTFGPGRIDYHLIEDAGGRPLLIELGLVNDAFATLALEEIIEVAADADFWWNSTYYADEKFGNSISALLADNPLNGSMAPAEQGTTFHIFGRGEDLYKTAYNYRADLILKDLVSILHPELVPDHEPLWMVLIDEE